MKSIILIATTVLSALCLPSSAFCFEGRINAVMTRGNQSDTLLYTVGTNFLRVEITATNWPNPVDILDRNSGELTLLFPNNRSFVRLKNSGTGVPPVRFDQGQIPSQISRDEKLTGETPVPPPPGIGPTNLPGMPEMPAMPRMPAAPNLPPGVGSQSAPGTATLPAMPGMSGGMPAMPMPMMPGMMEKLELQATGQKTNLLGFACEKFQIKQRGETMEIWATDQLFPFQSYVQNQPHRFGPRMIEEQWAELVKAKKLFPLLATLKFDNGAERFRFEVQSITPQKLTDEDETKLFQPPSGYFEIQPLPF